MSYFHCGHVAPDGNRHGDCNGYVGPLDERVCPCPCHDGHRAEDRSGYVVTDAGRAALEEDA